MGATILANPAGLAKRLPAVPASTGIAVPCVVQSRQEKYQMSLLQLSGKFSHSPLLLLLGFLLGSVFCRQPPRSPASRALLSRCSARVARSCKTSAPLAAISSGRTGKPGSCSVKRLVLSHRMLRTLGKEEQTQSEIKKSIRARWYLPMTSTAFPSINRGHHQWRHLPSEAPSGL